MKRLLVYSAVSVPTMAIVTIGVIVSERAIGSKANNVGHRSDRMGTTYGLNHFEPAILQKELPQSTAPVSRIELHEAIRRSGNYLVQSVGSDGQFVYRRYVTGHAMNTRYNMLRHAGSLYALAQFYHWQPDEGTWAALIRGRDFMRREMRPLSGQSDKLALWSRASISGRDIPLTAKLGGSGLALVALASMYEIDQSATTIVEMRRLANFICFMQKPDGGFYSKFIPSLGGRLDTFVSVYYPGEAALGLLMLYRIDPQPVWLDSALQALTFLAEQRKGQSMVPADHWALIATAELMSLNVTGTSAVLANDLPSSSTLQVEWDHALQVYRSILVTRPRLRHGTPGYGGFVADGRTCPTATRLEGILAMLPWLSHEQFAIRQWSEHTTTEGIRFLLESQIRDGELVGGIPRSVRSWQEGDPFFTEAFNRRVGEIRIDYVQHSLSAFIAYDAYWDDQRRIHVSSHTDF